ncbi:H-type lectin domain-containing protein [Streptomyces sp. NPDC005953]|uniref:H-type lectin domain-containing protein n=1 Tax=unclassified Streptomyces TaxID=2593676 RepID=UPI0033E4E654
MTVRVGRLTSGMTPEDHRLAASTAMAPAGALATTGGCLPGGLDLAPVPGSALQATLSAGRLWVQGTNGAAQGGYSVTIDAPVSLTFGAGHATYSRIDSVVVRVADPSHDSTVTVFGGEVLVVQGSPAGTPTAPTVPPNSQKLYDVVVGKESVGLDWVTGVLDRRRYTAALGGIVPPGSGVAFSGSHNGQYRDNDGVLERWNGTVWEPILRLGTSGQLQLGDVRVYRDGGTAAATNAIVRAYRSANEDAISVRSAVGDTASRLLVKGDGAIQWGAGGSTPTDVQLSRTAPGALRVNGDLVVRTHKAHYGESGTAYFNFTGVRAHTMAITFGTPFPTAPRVYTNINSGHAAAEMWSSRAHSVTATGFQLYVYNPSGTWSWSNMPIYWSAFAA